MRFTIRMIMDYMHDGTPKREAEIRKHFGNTPDVSKGLRYLLKAKYIEKSGKGGAKDPFKYVMKSRITSDTQGTSSCSERAAAQCAYGTPLGRTHNAHGISA